MMGLQSKMSHNNDKNCPLYFFHLRFITTMATQSDLDVESWGIIWKWLTRNYDDTVRVATPTLPLAVFCAHGTWNMVDLLDNRLYDLLFCTPTDVAIEVMLRCWKQIGNQEPQRFLNPSGYLLKLMKFHLQKPDWRSPGHKKPSRCFNWR